MTDDRSKKPPAGCHRFEKDLLLRKSAESGHHYAEAQLNLGGTLYGKTI